MDDSICFSKDDVNFSGFIMLKLEPCKFVWDSFITETKNLNFGTDIEFEHECHVTLVGKVYRNDILKNYDKLSNCVKDLYVIAEHEPSYFYNETSVCKLRISDSLSKLKLMNLRNEIFCNFRALESYPNYHPHITIGYFNGEFIKVPYLIDSSFKVKSILFSFKDNNNNEHSFEIV